MTIPTIPGLTESQVLYLSARVDHGLDQALARLQFWSQAEAISATALFPGATAGVHYRSPYDPADVAQVLLDYGSVRVTVALAYHGSKPRDLERFPLDKPGAMTPERRAQVRHLIETEDPADVDRAAHEAMDDE